MLRAVTDLCARRPVVVALWLALAGAGFIAGAGVFDRLVSDVGTVPGSESERGRSLMGRAQPVPVSITAVVHGRLATGPAARLALDGALADLRRLPGVVRCRSPCRRRPPARRCCCG